MLFSARKSRPDCLRNIWPLPSLKTIESHVTLPFTTDIETQITIWSSWTERIPFHQWILLSKIDRIFNKIWDRSKWSFINCMSQEQIPKISFERRTHRKAKEIMQLVSLFLFWLSFKISSLKISVRSRFHPSSKFQFPFLLKITHTHLEYEQYWQFSNAAFLFVDKVSWDSPLSILS